MLPGSCFCEDQSTTRPHPSSHNTSPPQLALSPHHLLTHRLGRAKAHRRWPRVHTHTQACRHTPDSPRTLRFGTGRRLPGGYGPSPSMGRPPSCPRPLGPYMGQASLGPDPWGLGPQVLCVCACVDVGACVRRCERLGSLKETKPWIKEQANE